ncbi:MAG: hypothetical protein K0S09_1050 [Sphingobacteriaceae bacterium]|nr:hypothetical protein [Sphingobacteriaceae bacterium]
MIQQYLDGQLDPKQMHELEKHALEDPFLADALEGFANIHNPVSHLSILQRQLEERIAIKHENKNLFNFTWQRLSVAATAGLMFIAACILFWMNSHKRDVPAQPGTKRVDVELNRGINKAGQSTAKDSPQIGWEKYREYLAQNTRNSGAGLSAPASVSLSFSVDDRGNPVTIKVENGVNAYCDEEAIRLVKEGPKWNPALSGQTYRAKVEVIFKAGE